jgi:hypothetical protein
MAIERGPAAGGRHEHHLRLVRDEQQLQQGELRVSVPLWRRDEEMSKSRAAVLAVAGLLAGEERAERGTD